MDTGDRGCRDRVEININPVEGLKHGGGDPKRVSWLVEININPVEGLKLFEEQRNFARQQVEININPVEGLKLILVLFEAYYASASKSTSTQSRD